jgi:acetylornithine deacetylase
MSSIIEEIQRSDSSFQAVVRRGLDRSPLETPENAGIVKSVQNAARIVLKHLLPIAGVPFWTDAALLSAVGIPSLLLGPSGGGAHAVEEWVDISNVKTCADIYLATAADFCR